MKHLLNSLLIVLCTATTSYATETIELTTKNSIIFRGVVDDLSVLNVELDILAKVASRGTADYPLYLVLDSPGGSIRAGEDFIRLVKNIPNLHTISIFAASMASAIVEGLPGDRLVVDDGILMFHRATGGFEDYFENGEVETQLIRAKKLVRSLEKRNSKRIGIDLKEYKKLVKDEWWISGQEAVEEGVADKVINLKCSTELTNSKTKGTIESLLGYLVDVEYSGCPLIRTPLKDPSNAENQTNVRPNIVNKFNKEFSK